LITHFLTLEVRYNRAMTDENLIRIIIDLDTRMSLLKAENLRHMTDKVYLQDQLLQKDIEAYNKKQGEVYNEQLLEW